MSLETAPEEWRPVPTDPDYEASTLGRIRSWKRGKGRVLVQKPTGPYGYLTVKIRVNGRNRITMVHRLVSDAFYGPRPEELKTRHLDGDNKNNRPSNLRYGTHAENMQDRLAHGRHPMANKTHCPQGHPYSGDNLRVINNGRHRRCVTCDRSHSRAGYQKAAARIRSDAA